MLWSSNRARQLYSSKLNIKVPDYCASHVTIHSSFSNEESLAPLLAEVGKKEASLQSLLDSTTAATAEKAALEESEAIDEDEKRDTFEESLSVPKGLPPENLRHYQDFICLFLSVFLQSNFSRNFRGISHENDPNDLIHKLASNRCCPDMTLFRRVAIDPRLVASAMPDGDNLRYASNGVAVNQLARLLDVAVLHFLSTINEHTDVYAIIWSLDYMKNLLSSLITSMNSLNSFGWYGAPHIRIRKGTAMGRRSISYPLQPPVFAVPPPVVVVGTPPTSPGASAEHTASTLDQAMELRDPVTGQRSPLLSSPSPHQTQSPLAVHHTMHNSGRSDVAGICEVPPLSSREPVGVTSGGGRQRRSSCHEQHRAQELVISPPHSPRSSLHSRQELAISPPHSPRSPPHPPSSPRLPAAKRPAERQRKVTPATLTGPSLAVHHSSSNKGSMDSIQEEEGDTGEREGEDGGGLHRMVPSLPHSYSGSMENIQEENEEDQLFRMDSMEKDYFDAMIKEVGPPIRPQPRQTSPEHQPYQIPPSFRTQSSPSLSPERSLTAAGDKERIPAPPGSPRFSPEFSPSPSPTHNAFANKGHGLRGVCLSPPPPAISAPKDIPKVDINLELATLLNGEGRISLIALLHAIANFPQSKKIWTEDVGEKCFSLIQLCMDIGMPPQQKDEALASKPAPVSSHERRKKFVKQDNVAFNKLGAVAAEEEEKPWRTHSKYTVEFAVKALIQCSTSCIVGCSTDVASCRLKQLHVHGGLSAHNRLIHNMRRIHLHSPAIFRQALIKFAHPSASSCHRIFQFLHVVLQYCMHGNGDLHFSHLLTSVVVAILSVTVDRIVAVDITEPSIQDVSLKEISIGKNGVK